MRYDYVWFFSYIFTSLVWYILVAWLCIALYRSLRLAALPWIAARYLIAFVALPTTNYLLRRIFPFGSLATPQHFTPDGWILLSQDGLEALCDLLVAVLAFSEVAFLVSRAFPDVRSYILRLLLGAHQQVRTLGITILVLAVSAPSVALAFLLLHGPFPRKV